MKSIKMLEERVKEARRNEKRIKLLNNLLNVVKDMNKLNGGFDLTEILANKPDFEADFYYEIKKLIRHIEETNEIILKEEVK